VVVELEQAAARCDESPLAAAGGSAAALEAFDRAVELNVAEHRLDSDLPLAVEVMTGGCGEHAAHERVHAAGPAWLLTYFQAPTRLKAPLRAIAWDRKAFALALCLQRAAALAQTRAATLWARHELLRIEPYLDPIVVLGRLVASRLSCSLALRSA
jgi:hypothetical protein